MRCPIEAAIRAMSINLCLKRLGTLEECWQLAILAIGSPALGA